jgi:hypothetical protein
MTTIVLEVPEDLAQRLAPFGDRLPDILNFALDMAGIPDEEANSIDELVPVWLEAIDFLASAPDAQEIIDFKLSPAAQERLDILMQHQQEEHISPQERAELDAYQQINHLFILLKGRARMAQSTT